MLGMRHIAMAIMALFLLAQGLTVAHAAEHGLDHDHDGVSCTLTVLAEDEADKLLPPTPDVTNWSENPEIIRDVTLHQSPHQIIASRAPPPRAPPV